MEIEQIKKQLAADPSVVSQGLLWIIEKMERGTGTVKTPKPKE